ncbi:hypothetical protein JT359_14110 [Candidatus Poribacteria bacterium]|nr:hypothetical protein [Candidatus Poribacteria bacterium]
MIKNTKHRIMDHPQNGIALAKNRWNYSSFSSFEIFTQITQILIKPVSNWVYSLFQRPILKKRFEILEKLEEHEKLENKPTLNTTEKMIIIPNTVLINTFRPYRNKSMHRDGQSPSIGSKYSTWQDQRSLIYTVNVLFSNILSIWQVKRFHIQTIPNQRIAESKRNKIPTFCTFWQFHKNFYKPSPVLTL